MKHYLLFDKKYRHSGNAYTLAIRKMVIVVVYWVMVVSILGCLQVLVGRVGT